MSAHLCDWVWWTQTACHRSLTWCRTVCQSPCSAPGDAAMLHDWMFLAVSCSWILFPLSEDDHSSVIARAETGQPRCRKHNPELSAHLRRSYAHALLCIRYDATLCRICETSCWWQCQRTLVYDKHLLIVGKLSQTQVLDAHRGNLEEKICQKKLHYQQGLVSLVFRF